jgi:hypothetical protein
MALMSTWSVIAKSNRDEFDRCMKYVLTASSVAAFDPACAVSESIYACFLPKAPLLRSSGCHASRQIPPPKDPVGRPIETKPDGPKSDMLLGKVLGHLPARGGSVWGRL